MIPNRAFSIWIGDTMPYVLQLCLKSFIVLHPHIDFTLYVSNPDLEVLPCIKKQYLDMHIGEGEDQDDIGVKAEVTAIELASDYYRLELLKDGGIYIDTDAFFVKPITELQKLDEDIIVSYILPEKTTHAVILCSGKNVESFFNALKRKYSKNKNFHRSLSLWRHYLDGYASHPNAKVKYIDYEHGFFYPKWDSFDELMTENPEYDCYAHHLFYSCADGKRLVEHLENRSNCNCYICRKFKEVENK